MHEADVLQIIQRVKAGDRLAAGALVAKLHPLVLKYAKAALTRYHLPPAALDDLVQEARIGLLQAFKRLPSTVQPAAFFSLAARWVNGYVARAAASMSNRAMRTVAMDAPAPHTEDATVADLLADPSPAPDECMASAQRDQMVQRLLQRNAAAVGPRGMKLLAQRVMSDAPMSRPQFARLNGVSATAVWKQEGKILARLKAQLARRKE